ncbi:Signal transduction histidine kinase [Nannocystis exedens]|uniref:histidine kinase n=1 Tax=Nannocystis exedens TaxID=54 RepID=A0A1I2DTC6_9BACT|nr:ATP-binding protein [Nannocystis exedens]PCC68909.1 hybrid sensor histidine kinase/response regulator [Nannocystis exedens]SFE83815.1 Signal transduction histidine kinase [Nannocystis exedens]
MPDPSSTGSSPLLRGIFAVHSQNHDVVRRARSFIALCITFAAITALLIIPIVLADPAGDLPMSLVVLASVIANYALGAVLARRGWVDLAGILVSANLSTSVAVAILFRFRELNDGIWFMALGVIISGLALRPRLIWWILGLNLGLTTLMLVFVPPSPAGPYHNFGKLMLLDALLVTTAIAAFIDATRSRDLFRRQARAVEDLKTARERAELANSAKSVFLANMSHELRTPLNAIIGFSELLQEDADDPAVRADLGKIRGAGHHLLAIISDILDLSRVEVGKLEVRADWFDLGEFLARLHGLVAPLAAAQRNTFTLTGSASGTVFTDEVRLRQALLNLLSNACKFTERGAVELTVRERVEDGEARLEFKVRDTGIGIAEDDLERVYMPFVQVDDSPTRRAGGTGLGLTLTREIVLLLGGTITVDSALGVGTTFTLTVPRRWAAETASAPLEQRVAGGVPAPLPG